MFFSCTERKTTEKNFIELINFKFKKKKMQKTTIIIKLGIKLTDTKCSTITIWIETGTHIEF